MDLGSKIREFGKGKFGNLKNFAKEMNMSPEQISQIVNNKYLPGTPFWIKLAKMGCDMNWIFKEDERNDSYIEIQELRAQLKKYEKKLFYAKKIFDNE